MKVTFKICSYMYKILHGLTPDYLSCAIARNGPSTARSNGAEKNGRKEQLCGGRPSHVEQLAKVYKINRDIGSFPKKKPNLFRLHYLA